MSILTGQTSPHAPHRLDANGRATEIPPVIPETDEEKRRYREAGERREYRLAMRNRLKGA